MLFVSVRARALHNSSAGVFSRRTAVHSTEISVYIRKKMEIVRTFEYEHKAYQARTHMTRVC